MIANYLKIALRYLAKNTVFSFINIAGLTVSLACAILMMLYTKDELSFDRFQKNFQSTYIVAIDVLNPDGSFFDKMAGTSPLHGPSFKYNVPEIESYVRVSSVYQDIQFSKEVSSQKILQADSNFFSFFTFPLLHGNPVTALRDPHNVVISQDMAIRLFGTEDALDKTILMGSGGVFISYNVTGVARRCPQNSSIQFETIIPFKGKPAEFSWVGVLNQTTFVKLRERSDLTLVAAKMQKVFETESTEAMKEVRSYGFTQSFHHRLQPFSEVHLSQDYRTEAGVTNGSNPVYSIILSGIAAFILAIACVNFINLTIARSTRRAKEIGIRKVVGSGRKQLIAQFLGESFLLCFISFVGAVLLSQLLLPLFNNLINKELSLGYLWGQDLVLMYVVLFVLTGLLAGFYPAVILSGYNPVKALYHRSKLTGKGHLQKSLVVFQFSLATFMIIATACVYLQFDYLTRKDLGYDADHLIKVVKPKLNYRDANVFKNELMKDASALLVSPRCHGMENGKIDGERIMHFTYDAVGENLVDMLKLKIIQGRNFSALHPSDSGNSVIVNEAFVKNAGWKEAMGQEVKMMDGTKSKVIGVIKDYHYESLKNAVEPQLLSLALNSYNPSYDHMLIKIQPGSESTSLALIEKTFKRLFPMQPYSYQFCNDLNRANYGAESKWKKVILLSAILTISIAGIGLFGLSILMSENRFKEIGIRKVLGATVVSIVVTLFKDHLLLIASALLIAIPGAYYAANIWLDHYPYRTDIGAGMFVGAGLLVALIAGATISYQTIKTAMINPVDSLRSE